MVISHCKNSIISFLCIHRCSGNLRGMAQPHEKSVFFRTITNALSPKSRLLYIVFLLFFATFTLSPLKICTDRTIKGLMQDSEEAVMRIVVVEKILNLMADRLPLDGLNNSDAADLEMMLKKKRAVLRAFTIIFLLLITIVAHIAARFYPSNDLIAALYRFRQFRCSEHITISEVYLSPHSGLAPPSLLS